eukprot:47907_1
MSQTAAKRKRDKLDEDGPEKKKAKVSELPILSALDAKQKAAIFAAYQTQNDTLFEISCGTFSIDVSETKQELIQHTKITLSNTYLNLRFSVKKKLKYCCVQYESNAISKPSFKHEVSKALGVDITSDNLLFLTKIIRDDITGLYPTVSTYDRRHETKKPKNLHHLLDSIWPTKITSKFERKTRAILQLQHEIDKKMKHFKTIVANEYEFRLDMYDRMNKFENQLKSIQIRAKKVLALGDAVDAVKQFKENANWKRDLDLRCDDMLTVEALLTSIEEDVRLNIAKIENRMINILGIASYDENDKKMALKLKITQRGFGQYKPTASFMEYSIVLSTMKKYEEEIKGLIDELSDIDASALIGNDTKAKRAKLALKRREKNADTVRLNRAKKKNELSNRNDANELSGDEQLQDDQKRSELDHDSFIDIEIESRLNQL